MAVTQADIDTLTAAIASGEKIVRIGEKWIEYRSIGDLIDARNTLQRELTAGEQAAAGTSRPRQTLLYYGGRGV